MASNSKIEPHVLYANILEEIKWRISAIDHCTSNATGLEPPFVKDFCYLQIRMICELIAIGCLVAHGDIKGGNLSKLQKEWSAQKIMDALEKLHPEFYPIPIKISHVNGGIHLCRVKNTLPKNNFIKLYGACGNQLHRGNLKKILKNQFPHQINYPEITEKAQSIIDLLNNHILVMKTGEKAFLGVLRNKNDGGRVQVAIAQTPPGSPMNYNSPDFLKDAPV